MSATICIDNTQFTLKDIIAKLTYESEILITENNQPIAHIEAIKKPQATFGNCRGMLIVS